MNNIKKRSCKIYLVFVAMFFLISAISTLFIRYIHIRSHMDEVQTEADNLSVYAKNRITSYEAYGWLIDHWLETGGVSEPVDEMKYSWINILDLPLVTEEEVRAMSKEEQEAYSYICYTRIAYGFDMLYSSFNTEELSCISMEGDTARVLFKADDDSSNNYHLPDKTIHIEFDEHRALKDMIDAPDGDGVMETYYSAEDRVTYLVYYIPIIHDGEVKAVIIWRRDYSDVEKMITRDSVGISIANVILLLLIDLFIIMIYRRYHREKMNYASMLEREKAEMDVCTKIQLSQLPDIQKEISGRNEFDMSAYIEPARGVGGDFYDCFMIDGHHIGLVIADVSDKGIPAAMFMMAARSLIKSEMKQNERPETVMRKVNEQLSDRNEAGMFVTVWLAVIDLITGKCSVVNAGHENPLVRHNGSWEICRYPHMMPAAVTPDAGYTQREYALEPGDMIFVYTDGVTDALDSAGRRFGEDGILKAIDRCGSTDPESIVSSMRTDIKRFSGNADQFDDICMICFKYNGTDTITVNASDDELSAVTELVMHKAERAGVDKSRISSLRLASEEIFGNIVDYAYPDKAGTVTVTVSEDKETGLLNITFTDHGQPFDPTGKSDPDIPDDLDDIRIGGLGIYLTKELTDSISYRYDDANILTLSVSTGSKS